MKKVLGWILGVNCIFLALGMLGTGHVLGGIGVALISLAALPPVYESMAKKARADAEKKGREPKAAGHGAVMCAVLFLSVCILVISVDRNEPESAGGKQAASDIALVGAAKAYRVVQADDTSFAKRRRVRWYIVADEPVSTAGDYAFTAIQAAKDLRKETNADVNSVLLAVDEALVGKGRVLANVTYIPDEMGMSGEDESPKWDVNAYDEAVSNEEINRLVLWERNKEAFRAEDGLIDEEALVSHLSAKLEISPEKFELPIILASAVEYDGEEYDVMGGKSGQSVANPPDPCDSNLSCLADKHFISASSKCERAIERLSKYDFEWTDGTFEVKFPQFSWHDKEKQKITYLGDKLKLQNGFGAWQNYRYACVFDAANSMVIDAGAEPGRF